MKKFPNLRSAVMAWSSPTMIWISAKRQVDYKTVESYYQKTVNIVRIPTGQQLEMKPEGQRRWNTETIYADSQLDLRVDDIIIFDCEDGQKYRVMNKTDWSQSGYIEYQITSDYR